MSATKILWGQILVVFLLVLGGISGHHRQVWRQVWFPGCDTDQSSRRSPEVAIELEGRVPALAA